MTNSERNSKMWIWIALLASGFSKGTESEKVSLVFMF